MKLSLSHVFKLSKAFRSLQSEIKLKFQKILLLSRTLITDGKVRALSVQRADRFLQMANTDESAEPTVLGKRDRNIEQNDEFVVSKSEAMSVSAGGEENGDDSDDDIGPMPMPEDSNEKNVRKKRKGEFSTCLLFRILTIDVRWS